MQHSLWVEDRDPVIHPPLFHSENVLHSGNIIQGVLWLKDGGRKGGQMAWSLIGRDAAVNPCSTKRSPLWGGFAITKWRIFTVTSRQHDIEYASLEVMSLVLYTQKHFSFTSVLRRLFFSWAKQTFFFPSQAKFWDITVLKNSFKYYIIGHNQTGRITAQLASLLSGILVMLIFH